MAQTSTRPHRFGCGSERRASATTNMIHSSSNHATGRPVVPCTVPVPASRDTRIGVARQTSDRDVTLNLGYSCSHPFVNLSNPCIL